MKVNLLFDFLIYRNFFNFFVFATEYSISFFLFFLCRGGKLWTSDWIWSEVSIHVGQASQLLTLRNAFAENVTALIERVNIGPTWKGFRNPHQLVYWQGSSNFEPVASPSNSHPHHRVIMRYTVPGCADLKIDNWHVFVDFAFSFSQKITPLQNSARLFTKYDNEYKNSIFLDLLPRSWETD